LATPLLALDVSSPTSCHRSTTATSMSRSATSAIAGGVQSLFGDGHVSFLKDSINLPVWQSLGSANGGEVLSADSY